MLRGAWLLLERELARLDRRGGRRRLGRVGLLLLLLCVLAVSRNQGPQAPFQALMVTQVVLALVLQPVRTAGLLIQTRLDGILPLLGLTPLRPVAVLAGVCGAGVSLALEGLLLALPLLSIAAAYGGLEPVLVLKALGGLCAAVALGTAAGAFVGADGHRSPSGAASRALATLVGTLAAPALIGLALEEGAGVRGAAAWATAPARALTLPTHEPPLSFAVGLAGQALLAAVLFLLGARRLTRTVLGGDGPPPLAATTPRRWWRRRTGVPARRVVAWRERRRTEDVRGIARLLRPGFVVVAAVILLFGGTAIGMTTGAATRPQLEPAYMMLAIQNVLLWLLALVWGLLAGARSYVEDRADGTLELLWVTGRRPGGIVGEKLWGAFLRGLPGVCGGIALHAGCSVAGFLLAERSVLTPAWVLIAIGGPTLLWLGGTVCALAIGQYCSALAPTAERAQTWAATVAGVLAAAVLLGLCPITAVTAMGSIAGGIPIDNIGLGTVGLFAGVVGAGFVPAIRGALVRSIR